MPRDLSEEDLHFFSVLSEVIFTNPFSDRGAHVDALAALGPGPSAGRDARHYFTSLLPVVSARVDRLARRGVRKLSDVTAGHRKLLRHGYLFLIYHDYVHEFDNLIKGQLAGPGKSALVPFADHATEQLMLRGFSRDAAVHYFALFYQLRRAYYFINDSLLGISRSMRRLRESLWNNVFTHDTRVYEEFLWPKMEDFSTLLLGETGTGKGSAATAIGRSGYIPYDPATRRFTRHFMETFIAANLSQFPQTLIESELFGHRKGAFTGAVDGHQGLFGMCGRYAVLFLDEIGDVAPAIQLKLLQVLQERTYRPVGGHDSSRFQGRVVAATNRSLHALRGQDGIRDDFFYRLCSDVITMPTLRQRIEESADELDLLVGQLIERMTGRESPVLFQSVMHALARDLAPDYGWPGNVRELEQAVRRVLLTRSYGGDARKSVDESDTAELEAEFRGGRLTALEAPATA